MPIHTLTIGNDQHRYLADTPAHVGQPVRTLCAARVTIPNPTPRAILDRPKPCPDCTTAADGIRRLCPVAV